MTSEFVPNIGRGVLIKLVSLERGSTVLDVCLFFLEGVNGVKRPKNICRIAQSSKEIKRQIDMKA